MRVRAFELGHSSVWQSVWQIQVDGKWMAIRIYSSNPDSVQWLNFCRSVFTIRITVSGAFIHSPGRSSGASDCNSSDCNSSDYNSSDCQNETLRSAILWAATLQSLNFRLQLSKTKLFRLTYFPTAGGCRRAHQRIHWIIRVLFMAFIHRIHCSSFFVLYQALCVFIAIYPRCDALDS